MKKIQNYFLSSLTWFLIFLLTIGWQIIPFIPSQHIPSTGATGEKMVLLWDTTLNGIIPTGWTNASATYGDKFLRGESAVNAGNTGGGLHTHTVGTVAVVESTTGINMRKKGGIPTALDTHSHSSFTTFTMDSATILPVYRDLVAITYDSGIPSALPADAIIMFDDAPPGGFSSYSSQNGKMIRINVLAGVEGGSTTHPHTNLSIVTSGPDSISSIIDPGTDADAATETHTHSYSGTSPVSTDHTPPHTEVILATVDLDDTSIPVGMIAMFNGDPNIDDSNWDIISDSAEAFYQQYIEGASSYQTGQGYATHTHTLDVISSSESATIGVGGGNPAEGIATTHTHTISGNFSDENNEPAYINVVVAKKQAALGVTGPDDVTLASIKPSETGETTFDEGKEIVVTDGGSGWDLTVIMTVTLNDGGSNTIPDGNVYIRKDGIVDGGDYTIWGGIISNVSETDTIESLDEARAVGIRSDGTGDDLTTVRPTIRVVADVDQTPADYDGVLTFTVI